MNSSRKIFGLLCCAALSACVGPAPERGIQRMQLGGWITYWDFAAGINAVEQANGMFDDVFFFVAHLDAGGDPVLHRTVDATQLRDATARIRTRGARAWLTVVNDVPRGRQDEMVLKDATVIGGALHDPDARRAHIDKLLQMVRAYEFNGLDIDYENLPVFERETFSAFVRELSGAAHAAAIPVSITVQPKKKESASVGAGAMDWRALCADADRVQIMMYNLHSAKTPPGPMATPEWIRDVMDFAVTQCAREKIVPVLKVSGMTWSADGAKGIQYTDASDLARRRNADIQRDSRGQTPYFSYEDGGMRYTTYYEDATSLISKLRAVMNQDAPAVVLWSLGRHDPALIRELAPLHTPRN